MYLLCTGCSSLTVFCIVSFYDSTLVSMHASKKVNSDDLITALDHEVFRRDEVTRIVFDIGGNVMDNLLETMATSQDLASH